MMKFFVKGQRIEITEREVIASGQIAFVTLKFTFDCSWKNLHKVVQFSQNLSSQAKIDAVRSVNWKSYRYFLGKKS